MNKITPDRMANRIRWGYLAAFLLLLVSYIISFTSAQKLIRQSQWINHTNEVIHDLDNILSLSNKIESSYTEFIITNNKQLLDEYFNAKKDVDSVITRLKSLTADNASQKVNLDTLDVLISDKFLWTTGSIRLFDSSRKIAAALIERNNVGISKMKTIEAQVRKSQQEEKNLLRTRYGEVTSYSYAIKVINILSFIVAILLTFYSILTFNKQNKEKREVDKKASAFQQQLEMRVEELASLNLELIELRNIEKFAVTGRISRTIAHEVRNPLTNINLATEQLRSEIPEGGDTQILFEMISRNSERINQLISDLLNSTRASELNYVEATINEILDSSLTFAQDRIELKHIKVVKDYDIDICPVKVDAEKVKIAFLNIIVNAIEAMGDYGTLHLSTLSKNDRCVVKITDNGRGMSKADVGRLFEPYFTTKEKGTGLGLTNTQNIILSHNGSINAESELGKGTSFTISFAFA
jgi:signal transduction histidine kinase